VATRFLILGAYAREEPAPRLLAIGADGSVSRLLVLHAPRSIPGVGRSLRLRWQRAGKLPGPIDDAISGRFGWRGEPALATVSGSSLRVHRMAAGAWFWAEVHRSPGDVERAWRVEAAARNDSDEIVVAEAGPPPRFVLLTRVRVE